MPIKDSQGIWFFGENPGDNLLEREPAITALLPKHAPE